MLSAATSSQRYGLRAVSRGYRPYVREASSRQDGIEGLRTDGFTEYPPSTLIRLPQSGARPRRFQGQLLLSSVQESLADAELIFGIDLFEASEGWLLCSAWQRSFSRLPKIMGVVEGENFESLRTGLEQIDPIDLSLWAEIQALDEDWDRSAQSISEMELIMQKVRTDFLQAVSRVFGQHQNRETLTEE